MMGKHYFFPQLWLHSLAVYERSIVSLLHLELLESFLAQISNCSFDFSADYSPGILPVEREMHNG
jgi:hypothetical protein